MSLVMKFGGTSVGDAESLRLAADQVMTARGEAPLVVLSALAGTTDSLLTAARLAARGELLAGLETLHVLREGHTRQLLELVAEPLLQRDALGSLEECFLGLTKKLRRLVALKGVSSPRSLDGIVGVGEDLSVTVFATYLRFLGCPVTRVRAGDVLMTDSRFGAAEPLPELIRSRAHQWIAPHLIPGRVVVMEGFVGATEKGTPTTLGRGGSDYSAALLAAALEAQELQIWTDVEGVKTCDPKLIPGARSISSMTFAQASVLASFGAKVLHPSSLRPAHEASIPVTVRHTRRPGGAYTVIGDQEDPAGGHLTALAGRGPLTLLTIESNRSLPRSRFLAKLFAALHRLQLVAEVMATAEASLCLAVEPDAPIGPLRREVASFASIDTAQERGVVAVVGGGLRKTAGWAQRIFASLRHVNVEMISMGADDEHLSLVVREEQRVTAMDALHRELFSGVES